MTPKDDKKDGRTNRDCVFYETLRRIQAKDEGDMRILSRDIGDKYAGTYNVKKFYPRRTRLQLTGKEVKDGLLTLGGIE